MVALLTCVMITPKNDEREVTFCKIQLDLDAERSVKKSKQLT